jgi:hypothetical protein
MITTLVFRQGNQRLEFEFPSGLDARVFLTRCQLDGEGGLSPLRESVQIRREIKVEMSHDHVLDVFNTDDDNFMRIVRDKASIKTQTVHEPDPGSVSGRYRE